MELLKFLVEAKLTTAVFIIGALMLVIAIVGKVKTILEPSLIGRVLLAVFGLVFMIAGFLSYVVVDGDSVDDLVAKNQIVDSPISQNSEQNSEQETIPTVQVIPTATVLLTDAPATIENIQPEKVLIQHICGPDAFSGDTHKTNNPLFKRPDGYTSGWITSDASDIILPDGTSHPITKRFVLFVDNLPEVQLLNVPLGSEHANTWGCWYRSDLTANVMADAEAELEKMRKEAPSIPAVLYRISTNGLEEVTR